MTERLYYTDSHLTEFDARIVQVIKTGDGCAGLRLDRTAFYPTGGGQPSDTGSLGAARVVECVDEGEGGVLHVVEGDVPAEGSEVRGRVYWPRRLDHMQQHTAQHVLSRAFIELFGALTLSSRLTADAAELDVDLKDASDERVERAVDRANEIIWDDRPVRVHQLTAEEAARLLPLRKGSARRGWLRVIEIEEFDFSPCGGTHVHRTGEVGLLAAHHWERAKGLVRLTFVAGCRAHADYRRANRAARSAAALFSVARDEVADAAARLQEEHKQLLRRARALEEIAAKAEARDLLEEAEAGAGNLKVVARVFEGRDADALRRLAFALSAHANVAALLGSLDEGGARLVFARSADAPGDMNALMREACLALEGRGGGRPDLAQGGGPRADRLHEALAASARSLSS